MLAGGLDELIILNRALDEAEIKTLMGGIVEALAVDSADKLSTTWAEIKVK